MPADPVRVQWLRFGVTLVTVTLALLALLGPNPGAIDVGGAAGILGIILFPATLLGGGLSALGSVWNRSRGKEEQEALPERQRLLQQFYQLHDALVAGAAPWTILAVDIVGSTSAQVPGGATTTVPGSLFAQTTNMGNHTETRFSIVPEVGITVGYQCTNNIRIFGGYNVLCWSGTVRAGEQINRGVNATYIPDPVTGAVAPSGAFAPWFHHRDENFYVHGYSVGVEFRW